MCHIGETGCRVTACSHQPLVQCHHQAWSHHSDLHGFHIRSKICCGYSEQTVPASLQSVTTQIMLPALVVSEDKPRLGQQFSTFPVALLAAGHTLRTAE